MDTDVLSRSIADGVLLIAGGAIASALFQFTTSNNNFTASVILSFVLAGFLVGVAYLMRSGSPPEEVRLTNGEAERIAEIIDRGKQTDTGSEELEKEE